LFKRAGFTAALIGFAIAAWAMGGTSRAQSVTPPPAPPFLSPTPVPINVTGKWHIVDGGTRFSQGTFNLRQVGTTIVGDYANGQGSISGQLATPRRMDATWNDDRGGGWITAYFSDDGHQVSGEWGFKGRKLTGRFVGDLTQAGKM
jgi:hypothetical protein